MRTGGVTNVLCVDVGGCGCALAGVGSGGNFSGCFVGFLGGWVVGGGGGVGGVVDVAVGGEFAACVYGFGGKGVVGYDAGAFAVGGCITGCDLKNSILSMLCLGFPKKSPFEVRLEVSL